MPRTGLEAKFSLRLTTAMALAGVDTGGLAAYTEQTAADPVLVALRDKISFDFRPDNGHTKAALTLELTDGRRLEAQHDSGVPASDVADQGRRLEAKFVALAEPILGARKASALMEDIGSLETLSDVRGMMGRCAGE
jgi:2-methylcitrate dehydratase PrpD